jgi:hypothetical protein
VNGVFVEMKRVVDANQVFIGIKYAHRIRCEALDQERWSKSTSVGACENRVTHGRIPNITLRDV